jgi:hypothetical protein
VRTSALEIVAGVVDPGAGLGEAGYIQSVANTIKVLPPLR